MRRFLTAAFALTLAGCGLTDTTQPTPVISTTFILQTINGTTLPYSFSNGSVVTSDVLTFFGDGTYSDAAQLRTGGVSVEQGYYTNANGTVTFTELTTGYRYTGSLSGTTFTEVVGELTKVYQQH